MTPIGRCSYENDRIYREPVRAPIFERYYRDYGIELTMTAERPKPENAHLTQGADCINVLSDTAITPELWDLYHQNGVRLGVTRCVGMSI